MRYTEFGRTGWKISRLGFGAMRLPIALPVPEGKTQPDLEPAVELLIRGFQKGINYVDTAYGYCDGFSEAAVGLALEAGWRDRVMLSTKLPLWQFREPDDFQRTLETQLKRLRTDHIDFYHFHALNRELFDQKVRKFKLLDVAARLLDQKVIRHLSFSFHDTPAVMKEIIDTEAFTSVLCQYNMLDQTLVEGIEYAASRGLGVVAMGPVGGGRLAFHEGVFEKVANGRTTPELALRFVLANPHISCALSGMGTEQMVDDNTAIASDSAPLSAEELRAIDEQLARCAELKKVYCTGCGYCQPCPAGVRIPDCLTALIYRKVYGFQQAATNYYNQIGDNFHPGKTASACTGCGACERKCPQKLPIRERLAEVRTVFGK